ncbi:hypothetical protein J1614_004369 [Plenodomus biglobosus]|nr:hypothetical protein J1614_004369 [Plenodomus biglobosus]
MAPIFRYRNCEALQHFCRSNPHNILRSSQPHSLRPAYKLIDTLLFLPQDDIGLAVTICLSNVGGSKSPSWAHSLQ